MKNLITTIYLIKSFIGIILLITCFINLQSQVRLVDIAPKQGNYNNNQMLSTDAISENCINSQISVINIPLGSVYNQSPMAQIRLVDVILKETENKSKTEPEFNSEPRLVDVILKESHSKTEPDSESNFESEIKHSNIAVKPVYPNPVIDQITIPFEVLKASNVYLQIYNSNKMLIKKIFDGEIKTKGHYETNINLSNQPNGIYFYSIVTENQTVNGKFIKL